MKTIWVVMGTTGEYSDRSEWPVKAFFEEQPAEAFALQAKVRAEEIREKREHRYDTKNDEPNEFDPDMRMDYTGTDYYAMGPIELVEAS